MNNSYIFIKFNVYPRRLEEFYIWLDLNSHHKLREILFVPIFKSIKIIFYWLDLSPWRVSVRTRHRWSEQVRRSDHWFVKWVATRLLKISLIWIHIHNIEVFFSLTISKQNDNIERKTFDASNVDRSALQLMQRNETLIFYRKS